MKNSIKFRIRLLIVSIFILITGCHAAGKQEQKPTNRQNSTAETIQEIKEPETEPLTDTPKNRHEPTDKTELSKDSVPEIQLSDPLSSTMNSFLIRSGNYSWSWQENHNTKTIIACGSHPLDCTPNQENILDIPNYNHLETVNYILHCTVMPKTLTIREWEISQVGQSETAQPSETFYQNEGNASFMIPLKHNKIYEITAEWPEEELNKTGFYGQASYTVITD